MLGKCNDLSLLTEVSGDSSKGLIATSIAIALNGKHALQYSLTYVRDRENTRK